MLIVEFGRIETASRCRVSDDAQNISRPGVISNKTLHFWHKGREKKGVEQSYDVGKREGEMKTEANRQRTKKKRKARQKV